MTYVKTYLSTLKTHVVNLERDAKGLSRDLQRLEVRGKHQIISLISMELDIPVLQCQYAVGNGVSQQQQ